VKLSEGSARGEASRRKPKDGNKFASFGKPPEVKLLSESQRNKFIKPPEVKLPEGSRQRCSFPKDVQKKVEPQALPSESECVRWSNCVLSSRRQR
jgi:hypothetical protein